MCIHFHLLFAESNTVDHTPPFVAGPGQFPDSEELLIQDHDLTAGSSTIISCDDVVFSFSCTLISTPDDLEFNVYLASEYQDNPYFRIHFDSEVRLPHWQKTAIGI